MIWLYCTCLCLFSHAVLEGRGWHLLAQLGWKEDVLMLVGRVSSDALSTYFVPKLCLDTRCSTEPMVHVLLRAAWCFRTGLRLLMGIGGQTFPNNVRQNRRSIMLLFCSVRCVSRSVFSRFPLQRFIQTTACCFSKLSNKADSDDQKNTSAASIAPEWASAKQ